jgi:CDP-diacylglycerol--serine O-phosphatidyltransferase
MKRRPGRRRARMRRAIIVVPSLFTLANLFFGVWSLVLAGQGEFYRASWYIVIAGVLDMLDGVFARMSRTGTAFGAELDSLVDMVSFGIAPAYLIWVLHFADQGQFAWVFSYAFAVCVALRLARYNLQTEGPPKRGFTGLPSPAAGMTIATYYPFTQTDWYQTDLVDLPWNQILIFLTIAMALAMVSHIRYARLPRIGVRSRSGVLGLAVNLTILGFGIWSRDIFFFPLGITYVSYGIVRAALVGFLERGDEEDDADAVDRPRIALRPRLVPGGQRKEPDREHPPAQGV